MKTRRGRVFSKLGQGEGEGEGEGDKVALPQLGD